MRLVRRDRLAPRSLVAAPHAIHLERWTDPEPLERRVTRLAERGRCADLGQIARVVERQRGDLAPFVVGQRGHVVVEPIDRDPAVRRVKARDELGHRVQGVRDGASVAARVKASVRTREAELQARHPAARDRDRGLVDSPHRAVRR